MFQHCDANCLVLVIATKRWRARADDRCHDSHHGAERSLCFANVMQECSPTTSDWWRYIKSLGNKGVKAPEHVQCVSLIMCRELSEQLQLGRSQDCSNFVRLSTSQRLCSGCTHQALG